MPALIPSMVAAIAAQAAPVHTTPARAIVSDFLQFVRSGDHPELAARFLAPAVSAHQLTSEGEVTIVRTPSDYAEHVRDFRRLFGSFKLQIDEILAEGDRVYVRWRQIGRHVGRFEGEEPTGKELTEIASVVYRVSDGRIAEYWIQADRKGLELQLGLRTTQPMRAK